jgi:hypothetical protein
METTMPRPKKLLSLEARVDFIISSAASAIAAAVRQDMTGELQRLLAGDAVGKTNASRVGRPRGGAGQKRNAPKSCVFQGCGNASKGPRWSFLCDEHKGVSKAERKKLLVRWKAQRAPRRALATPVASAAKNKKRGARRGRKKAVAAA